MNFFHGNLLKEVYINQPPDFIAQGKYRKVCHLIKSLYGLKQSFRMWLNKFSEIVCEFEIEEEQV